MTAEMKFKVWHIPQIPMEAFEVFVPTLDEAKRLCDTLGNYDLFQFEHRVKPDYSNVNGIMWRGPSGADDWEDYDEEEQAEIAAELEEKAKAIYDGFTFDGPGEKPAWVDGGNSLKQNEARRLALPNTQGKA